MSIALRDRKSGRVCRHLSMNMIKIVLQDHPDAWDIDNQALLCWAAATGHYDFFEYLLGHDCVDPGANNQEPIRMAARYGHVDILRRLMGHSRVNIAASAPDCLQIACKRGHLNVVCCLLEDVRVNLRVIDQGALAWACVRGHWAVVNRLLDDSRLNPGMLAWSILQCAWQGGNPRVIDRILQDTRVHLHVLDASRSNILHWAPAGRDYSHQRAAECCDRLLQDERIRWCLTKEPPCEECAHRAAWQWKQHLFARLVFSTRHHHRVQSTPMSVPAWGLCIQKLLQLPYQMYAQVLVEAPKYDMYLFVPP